MECREIMDVIEKRYPRSYASDWDNVGLLSGRAGKKVEKILIALDADDSAVEQAAAGKADMLITHHPMIFRPLKQVNDMNFIGRRLLTLARNDISYYAMHTNYDILGMADLAGEMLHMEHREVLEVTNTENGTEGIGRIADLREPMRLEACAKWVKETFHIPSVKVFGDPDEAVKRLAISPGSGKSVIDTALQKRADVLVTGDIDHHEGIDANAQHLSVIDAGHYGIEHIFIEDMKRFCTAHFPGIETETVEIRHPFWVL